MSGPKSSNAVVLIRRIEQVLINSGMYVTMVKEPDINQDSAVEHMVDLDIIYDEVVFNVRIESIMFAGSTLPIEPGD